MTTEFDKDKASISLNKADILLARCISILEEAVLELTAASIFLPEDSDQLNKCKDCVKAAATLLSLAYNSYFERVVK